MLKIKNGFKQFFAKDDGTGISFSTLILFLMFLGICVSIIDRLVILAPQVLPEILANKNTLIALIGLPIIIAILLSFGVSFYSVIASVVASKLSKKEKYKNGKLVRFLNNSAKNLLFAPLVIFTILGFVMPFMVLIATAIILRGCVGI